MKLRTHHLIQRIWRTRFRFRWKNPPHFQIQTQTLIQFRIPNLRCWRLRCDFGPGIHLLFWPLCGYLQQYVIFGRIFGSSRGLTKTRWTTKTSKIWNTKLNQSLSLNLKVRRILPPKAKTSPSDPLNQMMSSKFHLTILKYKLNFTSKKNFLSKKLNFDKQFYMVISTNHLLGIWIQKVGLIFNQNENWNLIVSRIYWYHSKVILFIYH